VVTFETVAPGSDEGAALIGPPAGLAPAGIESEEPVADAATDEETRLANADPPSDPTGGTSQRDLGTPRGSPNTQSGGSSARPSARRSDNGAESRQASPEIEDAVEPPSQDAPLAGDPGSSGTEAGPSATRTQDDVLEDYRHALESEDLDELGRLYGGEIPKRDLEMLRRIFDNADELAVDVEPGGVRNDGDRSVVDVDFPMRYVLKQTGRSQKYTLKVRMTLVEGPGGWQLVELKQR
jgi:hypothetical protein